MQEAKWQNTTIFSEDIYAKINDLKEIDGQILHINGSGTLVNSLIKAGLIDELHLLVHPVVVGEGKRFFNEMNVFSLKFVSSEHIDKGVILIKYDLAP